MAGSLAAIDKWVQDMNSEDEDNSHSDNNNSADSSDDDDEESASANMTRKKSLLFALALPHEKEKEKRSSSAASGSSRDGSNKVMDVEIMGNPSNLETNSKDSFSEYSNSSGSRQKNKILSRDAILSMVRGVQLSFCSLYFYIYTHFVYIYFLCAQCTGGGRDSARDSARDSDEEDSEIEVPDHRVNLNRRSVQQSDEKALLTTQAAPVRKRDADVRNRLKRGSSHGTPRATPKRLEEAGDEPHTNGISANAEVRDTIEVKPRNRRVVPDFPIEEPVQRSVASVRGMYF